ncbi:MAG: hypothetical protein GC155_11910 [Alphaproteobacteria bacterium]|nr:hypothetical protein [Alphaproteobacteria bacterium]
MKFTARLALLCAGALLQAPAFAEPAKPAVWECTIERKIESGKTTMYDAKMRADRSLRFTFVADTAGNRGCLLDAAKKDDCAEMFTGAAETGGMLRLDVMDEHNVLDLVNIFPSSGRFMRIHGDTQWMGKPGDCVPAKNHNVTLP